MTAADVSSCFCGCLPLKKGCIGIGVVTFIYGAIAVGIQIPYTIEQINTSGLRIDFIVMFTLGGIFNLINVIAGPLLILIVLKENARMLLIWLIYMAVYLNIVHLRILDYAKNIGRLLRLLQDYEFSDIFVFMQGNILWASVDLSMLILYLYFMVVIYSFRKSLLPTRESPVEMEQAGDATEAKDSLLE